MYAQMSDQRKMYIIAFQVHWLGTNLSERLGWWSIEVTPIQKRALGQ